MISGLKGYVASCNTYDGFNVESRTHILLILLEVAIPSHDVNIDADAGRSS